MAAPTVVAQLNAKPDITSRFKFREIRILLVGAAPTYVALANGGLIVDLTKITDSTNSPRGKFGAGDLPPNTDIAALIVPGGFSAYLVKNPNNPTLANYILQIFSAAGTEVVNGAALNAALFGTTNQNAPPFVFQVKTKNFN